MIDHTGIGVQSVKESANFWDPVMKALGHRRVEELPDWGGIGYGRKFPIFWIDKFHPFAVRQHIAFATNSRAEVDAFHKAALQAGGDDNGAPGLREPPYPKGYYAAFVIDPEGNNIEAVYRE